MNELERVTKLDSVKINDKSIFNKVDEVKTDLTNAQSVAGSITQVEAPTNTQNTPPVNTQNNTSVIPNIVNNNNVQIIGGNSNTNTNNSSNIIYSTNNYSNSTSTPIIGKGPGE